MSLNWNNNSMEKNFGFNFKSIESPFHAIYFVDSITGSLLLSNRYSDKLYGISKSREDLISSFLNALNLFIKEIKINKDEDIQEINFKDTRILYEKKGRLVCIGISKKTDLHIERRILTEILNDFYFKFENEINQFKGYIDPKILDYKNRLKNLNLNSLVSFNKDL